MILQNKQPDQCSSCVRQTGKGYLPDNICWLWISDRTCMHACCRMYTVCVALQLFVCLTGVLLFDHSQGFWLSHSIPHFPSFPEKGFVYPSSGKVNGQTALCVTYQYEQFFRIGEWTIMKQQGLTYSSCLHIPNVSLQQKSKCTHWYLVLQSVHPLHTSMTKPVTHCIYSMICCLSTFMSSAQGRPLIWPDSLESIKTFKALKKNTGRNVSSGCLYFVFGKK